MEDNVDADKKALEKYRIQTAYWLSLLGIAISAILIVVLVLLGWSDSGDIVAVAGLITGVLGTLVGLFFGIQVGSEGKDQLQKQADAARNDAEKANRRYYLVRGKVAPDVIDELAKHNQTIFTDL